jgi:RND family efflux transporter MFP subunit
MGPRAGGVVHKGELIVHLDTRTLEADAGALKANLVSAVAVENNDRKEMQREQRLMQEGGSSASSVEQYQTRVRSDQANVHALKKQLESLQVKISYGHILAPISGRIAKRLAEPGDAVFPGKTIYTLTADKGGRVIVTVPLDTLTRIKPGGKVELSLGEQTMMTRITRINPSLDALAMGSLEIDLPQRPFHLPDSAPIEARVLTASATGLTVPLSALRPAGKSAVRTLFRVVDQPKPHRPYLQQVSVNIQLCGKARCVIADPSGTNNLHAGDHVVTAHGSVLLQLHDGDPVSVNQQAAVQP